MLLAAFVLTRSVVTRFAVATMPKHQHVERRPRSPQCGGHLDRSNNQFHASSIPAGILANVNDLGDEMDLRVWSACINWEHKGDT